MSDRTVRRRALLTSAATLAASVAGCISTSPTKPGSQAQTTQGGSTDENAELLKGGGSSTVYPVANKAASYWGANPPADDQEYWGPSQYQIETDQRLANYWGSLYGFESTDESPPFNVTINLSHSGTGLENLKAGRLDMGNASAPVSAELPEASEEELSKFTNHVVGVDAQPIVVSKEIYEAGVQKLTGDTLKAIYRGEITDWADVPNYDGPSKQIQCVGRAEGSGTDTAFRVNLFGDPDAPMDGVDVRKGQNQQVNNLVSNSNNAIAYMALAFVGDSTPAITLEFKGKEFIPGENLSDPDYPLARDLHCYTYEGTSKLEAAFLNMIISDFGQQVFVKAVGYAALTDERQEEERNKLPDQV